MKRQTYLDTDIIRKFKCYVGMKSEVICYGDRFFVVAHTEHGIASASGAQPLYDNTAIPTSMGRPNSHVGDKLLQSHPVSVRKTSLGRECRRIVFLKELHEEAEKLSWLVHYSGSNVDIQIHSIFGRTDGLEVSPP